MICPDCETEVDSVVNSTKTCLACYKRWQNMKYRKQLYIPLKDIKGSIEYNRAMGRREAAAKRNSEAKPIKVTKLAKVTKQPDINPLKEAISQISKEVEKELNETLEKEMEKRGVSKIQNTLTLTFLLPAMYDLFQEENVIKQRMILDAIYENQIIDSLHILKQENKDDFFLDTKVGARQRLLQELRTPNKYELELYNSFKDFIDSVKTNKELMNLLLEANTKFQKTLNNQKNPVYVTNSEFMKDFDFVIHDDTKKDRKIQYNQNVQVMKHKFRVRIYNCKGLFGNPTPQTFIYKNKDAGDKETYLEAVSKLDATRIIQAIMRDHFSSVKYSPKDIEIIPWEKALQEMENL